TRSIALYSPRKENEVLLPQRGTSDSFWGLRDFYQGDNLRQIAWKNSARLGKWMVKETEKEAQKSILFCLEPEAWRTLNPQELDRAVSFAASLVVNHLQDHYAVGFQCGDFFAPPSSDRQHVHRI